MPLGHEFSGVVREVGAEVTGVAPGQRVVVHPGNDVSGRIGGGSAAGGLADVVLPGPGAENGGRSTGGRPRST